MSNFDKNLWRIIIWTLGLSTPILASLHPRSFVTGYEVASDSLSHQVLMGGGYLSFLLLAVLTFTRRSRKNTKQLCVRAFFLLTILMAAMPTISSLVSGGTLQWALLGAIGLYSATYFLPAPSLEWWVREVRVMLLVVFVYGSLVAAVLFPHWAWNKGYAIEETSLVVIPWRLFGTANHANDLAPLAVFAWMLGRFPGCRLKGEYLHGAAVLLALLLTQSKTMWAVALVLIGVYILIKIASLGGVRKYLAYFTLGTGLYAVLYIVKYSRYVSRIEDALSDPAVITLSGRLILWQYAIETWLGKPWIGQGLDAWSSKAVLENVNWAAPHAHNQILQILSQSGLIGMLVVSLWALYYFKILRRAPAELRIPLWWMSAIFFLPGVTEVVLQFAIGSGGTIAMWIIFTAVLIVGKSFQLQKGQ